MIKWHPTVPRGRLVAHTAVCVQYTVLVYCMHSIQLFQERLSEEMRIRQSRKVIWDMTNTLFVTPEAVEPTFVAFL